MNLTRILILKSGRVHLNPQDRVYKRPNYKNCTPLREIIEGVGHLWNEFVQIVEMSREKRKRKTLPLL